VKLCIKYAGEFWKQAIPHFSKLDLADTVGESALKINLCSPQKPKKLVVGFVVARET